MIISRARTFFVVGFIGLLLSIFGSLWYTNISASAASACTFALNSAKTEIGMACRSSSGNTVPFNQTLKKEGSTRIYSFTGPTGCKTAVELKSNTSGTHTTKGPASNPVAACTGFPSSQGDVTIKAAAGNPAEDARLLEEKTKNCEDQGKSYDEKTDACVDGCADGATNQDGTCSSSADSVTSCSVDGIGWIICPVMSFLAKLNDAAFNFLSGFLIVPTIDKDGGTKWLEGTKIAWDAFRNFANIAFVVGFMIIIYSQITSAGVSNYGIKRLLPRLIIAAILVNVSYYLCVIAVDVSNIIGSSLVTLFNDISTNVVSKSSDLLDPDAAPGGWDSAVATLLGGGAILGILILILLAPATLLVFGAIIFILMARQALIILLVAVSPLAFVAYLLPNTEQWFKKWWKIFSTLLMVFPIIALVFGASTLASVIIGNVAADDGQMLAIMALGIQALPLFAVPVLLKGSLSALGTIGQKLSGYADKAQGMATGQAGRQLKRHAESLEARAANANNSALRFAGGYRARRDFRHKSMEGETARGQEDALAQHVLGATRADGTPRYSDRQRAAALDIQARRRNEEIQAANTDLDRMDNAAINSIALGQSQGASQVQRMAAQRRVMETGSYDEKRAVLAAGGESTEERQALRDLYYKSGMNDYFGNGLGDSILNGTVGGNTGLDQAMAGNFGAMTAETLTKGTAGTADINRVAGASPAEAEQLRTAVEAVEANPQIAAKITSDMETHYGPMAARLNVERRTRGAGGGGTTLISGDRGGLR